MQAEKLRSVRSWPETLTVRKVGAARGRRRARGLDQRRHGVDRRIEAKARDPADELARLGDRNEGRKAEAGRAADDSSAPAPRSRRSRRSPAPRSAGNAARIPWRRWRARSRARAAFPAAPAPSPASSRRRLATRARGDSERRAQARQQHVEKHPQDGVGTRQASGKAFGAYCEQAAVGHGGGGGRPHAAVYDCHLAEDFRCAEQSELPGPPSSGTQMRTSPSSIR